MGGIKRKRLYVENYTIIVINIDEHISHCFNSYFFFCFFFLSSDRSFWTQRSNITTKSTTRTLTLGPTETYPMVIDWEKKISKWYTSSWATQTHTRTHTHTKTTVRGSSSFFWRTKRGEKYKFKPLITTIKQSTKHTNIISIISVQIDGHTYIFVLSLVFFECAWKFFV